METDGRDARQADPRILRCRLDLGVGRGGARTANAASTARRPGRSSVAGCGRRGSAALLTIAVHGANSLRQPTAPDSGFPWLWPEHAVRDADALRRSFKMKG